MPLVILKRTVHVYSKLDMSLSVWTVFTMDFFLQILNMTNSQQQWLFEHLAIQQMCTYNIIKVALTLLNVSKLPNCV